MRNDGERQLPIVMRGVVVCSGLAEIRVPSSRMSKGIYVQGKVDSRGRAEVEMSDLAHHKCISM